LWVQAKSTERIGVLLSGCRFAVKFAHELLDVLFDLVADFAYALEREVLAAASGAATSAAMWSSTPSRSAY
jgi:hypothetical protein